MLAFARIDLGVSEEEFWDMTPALYFAYADRCSERLKRTDYYFGLVVESVRHLFAKRRSTLKPLEVWPWRKREKVSQQSSSAKVSELRNNIATLGAFLKSKKQGK